MELCSESKGIISVEYDLASLGKLLPREIIHSLFAIPIFFPDLIKFEIRSNPAKPVIANMIISVLLSMIS